MKLATYQDGSRDGQLVVVSRDLMYAHYATSICNTMQQLLDDWNFLSPQLQDIYDALNQSAGHAAGQGKVRHAFPFDAARCMAPLPRIYQWVSQDGKKLLAHAGGDIPADCDAAFLTADVPKDATQAQLRDALRLRVQFNPSLAVTLDELAA
jgi:Fumarylacetoacetase N-terminal domain 2